MLIWWLIRRRRLMLSTPNIPMLHNLARLLLKQKYFYECFNDNKPRGINDKFYEW